MKKFIIFFLPLFYLFTCKPMCQSSNNNPENHTITMFNNEKFLDFLSIVNDLQRSWFRKIDQRDAKSLNGLLRLAKKMQIKKEKRTKILSVDKRYSCKKRKIVI